MNVLVIAPHPDDEAIGCGGAIRLHAVAGDRVSVVFLTSGEKGLKGKSPQEAWQIREAEAEAAAAVLGIADLTYLRLPDGEVGRQMDTGTAKLQQALQRYAPDRVYVPHPGDGHADHEASWPLLRAAYQGAALPRPGAVLGYEVWTPISAYDDGADVTAVMGDKCRAVRCHASQNTLLRFDRGVRGLNRYRGAMAWGCAYAEVFQHLFLEPEV